MTLGKSLPSWLLCTIRDWIRSLLKRRPVYHSVILWATWASFTCECFPLGHEIPEERLLKCSSCGFRSFGIISCWLLEEPQQGPEHWMLLPLHPHCSARPWAQSPSASQWIILYSPLPDFSDSGHSSNTSALSGQLLPFSSLLQLYPVLLHNVLLYVLRRQDHAQLSAVGAQGSVRCKAVAVGQS